MKHVSAARILRSLTALVLALLLPFNAMAATLTLPAALTTVQEQAFMNNASVEEVIVPEGTLRIESQAFAGCTALTRAVIPASVEYIAQDAFDGLQDALVIEAPADSYAAAWAREHGFVTRDPNAVLTGEIDQYFPTLYLGGNLDRVDVASVQLDYALEEGEAIDWQLENLSGEGTVNLYIDEISEDGVGAFVFADSVQDAGESVWRLTAAAPDGQKWSAELTMEVVPMPEDMPTEIIAPYPVTGTVGEHFVFKPSERVDVNGVIPDNGNLWFYGFTAYRELWEHETFELIDDGMNGAFAFTPDQSGRYGITISLYLGNHRIDNENIIVIGSGASADGFLAVLESDPVYLSGVRDFWAGNASLERFPLLPGETVEWSIELIDTTNEEPAAILNIDETGMDPMFRDLFISDMSGVPGTDTYRITARVGDSVFTYDYVLDVQEMPDTLPTAITVPQDYFEVEIGDTLELYREDIRFVDGEVSEDVFVESHYWMLDQISHEQEVWDIDDGYGFRFVRNGRYTIEAALVLGGIEYTLPITIKVGTGVSDMAYLRTNQMVDTVYLESTEDNYIGNFEVGDYEPLENETFDWQLECLGDEENAPVRLYIDNEYDDGRGVNVHFEDVSGETGSVTYRITVRTSEGLERSAEITVSVKHLPGNLPTALAVPQTDYQLSVGESIYLAYADVHFADGEVPEDVTVTTEFWDVHLLPDVEMTEDGIRAWFFADGRYMIYAAKRIGSYTVVQPITITVGSGLAEDVHLVEEHVNMTHYVNMGQVNWAGDLYLENYQVFEGETLEWKAERIDENEGAPAELIIDPTWDENRGAGLRLVNFNGETGSMTWRVTLESSFGFSWSREYDIEVLPRPENLPTGVTMPEEVVYLEVGETYYANYSDIQFVGGEVPEGVFVARSLMPNELEEYPTLEWTEEGFEVTFHEDGRHIYTISGTINGVEMYKDIALIVGSGISEHARLEGDQLLHTAYIDADHDAYVGAFWVEDYLLVPGEEYEWTLDLISDPENAPVKLRLGDENDGWRGMNIHAGEFTGETGSVTYRLRITTGGGLDLSTDITIDVVERPDNLPTALNVPETQYFFNPGDVLELYFDEIDFADGEVPEGADVIKEFWECDWLPGFEWIEGGFRAQFDGEGHYMITAAGKVGNHTVTQPITIIVGDGIDDAVELTEKDIHMTHFVNMDQVNWAGELHLDNYELAAGESLAWKAERIDGNEGAPAELICDPTWDEERGTGLRVVNFSGETGSMTWRVTLESSFGFSWSKEYDIEVLPRPENLPTGVTMPEEVVYLEVGETYYANYSDIQFVDGEVTEDMFVRKEFWLNSLEGYPTLEWTEEGFEVTFHEENRYIFNAVASVNGVDIVGEIALIVGGGISEHARLEGDQLLHTAYIDADHDAYVGAFWVEDYLLVPDEEYEWTLDLISDPENAPVKLRLGDENDGWRGMNIHAGEFTGETGSVTYRLRITTGGGLDLSTDITIDVVERPDNLPTALNVPETQYFFNPGDVLELYFDEIDFADGEVPEGADVIKEFWECDWLPGFEWIEGGFRAQFDGEGHYMITAAGKVGNHTVTQPITITVGDGIPENVHLVEEHVNMTHYVNMGQVNWAGDLYLENYQLLEGETLEWRAERIDDNEGDPAELIIDPTWDENRGAGLRLVNFSGETGSMTWRVTLESSFGFSWSREYDIEVLPRPENLPTGVTMPEEVVYLNVGDTYHARYSDIQFVDGEVTEGTFMYKEFWLDSLEGYPTLEWTEDGFEVTFHEENRYIFQIVASLNGVEFVKDIALIVGGGISEHARLEGDQLLHTAYIDADHDAYVGAFWVEDYLLVPGEEYEWTLDLISDPENAPVKLRLGDENDGWRGMNIHAGEFTGETGSVTYRLRITTGGGLDLSTDITIDVVERPDNLPTALNVPETLYYFNPGDVFELYYDEIDFADGEVPEGADVIKEFWECDWLPGFEWIEGGFRAQFDHDDRYQFTAAMKVGNHTVTQPITIIVGSGMSEGAWLSLQCEYDAHYINDQDHWLLDACLEDFLLVEGDHVEWTIECTDETDTPLADMYIQQVWEEGRRAAARISGFSGETGVMNARLTATVNGEFSVSEDFQIEILPMPEGLPTEIAMPAEEIHLEIGEWLYARVEEIFFVDGFVPEDARVYTEFHTGDLADNPDFTWADGGFDVVFHENGNHRFTAFAGVNGVEYRKEIVIYVGTGYSEDAYVDWAQEIETIYTDLPEESTWIGWGVLENFAPFGEDSVQWRFDRIDEGEETPVELYMEVFDGVHADIRYTNVQGTGSVTYRLSVATSNGFEDSYDFTVNVEELPGNLPTDIDVGQTHFDLEVGGTYEFDGSQLRFVDGNVPQNASYRYHLRDLDPIANLPTFEWTENGFRVTFEENGRFAFGVGMQLGNYVLFKEITISVGSGIADDAHVEWYQELFTAYNDGEDAWIGHTSLHSYPRFGDEELTWTIERIDENENAPVELYIDNLWEDHTGANIHLRNLNGETGTVTYRVTVESSYGFTDSCEVTLDVVETPDNLPTLLHVPAEEWRLEIGDELVLHDWDLTLSDDGEVPEGAYVGYEYWDPEGVFYNQEVRWNDEHGGFTVRFHDNGRYVMTVAMRINNYLLQREMRFTVGNGISEDTYLDLYHAIDPVYVGGDNAWIGNAYVNGYALFEGESIEWTITRRDDGQEPVVDVVLDEEGFWDDTLGANYHVENVNATGETAYIIQAKLPTGETFEQELVAHVQEMPEGLPTELITPWDSCLFTVGDTFTFMLSEIQFGEGYLPENAAYHMDIWPDGEIDQLPTYEWFNNEEGDEGVSVTFTEPGVYNICAAAWIGNYMLYKDIPITVTGGDDWKIAILTGSESQSEEEYTAARRALDTYGYGHVILDTYPDNFVAEVETTIARIEAFARDPEVKAIIVAQSVPGTLEGFNRVSESRDDVLLISGVPMEDIVAMHDVADVVMLSDEGRQAEPIMNKCEEWGIEVFVHYSFPRHLELSEVAERRDLLAGMAEELGIEFVEVEIPDPVADTGLEYSRSFVYGDVAGQMDRYVGRKVAFFCTNCGVQSALQSAVLAHRNAYYPQPCCPSTYHGFGETLDLSLNMNDPRGALSEVANALNERGAAGRFSTWAAPVNMGIVDIGVEYAVAYAGGALSPDNDRDLLRRLAESRFRGALVTNDEFENVYTILLSPINFMDYVTMY